MSLLCLNSSECCPEKIWPDFVLPGRLRDQLSGLTWQMPITNFDPPWNNPASAGNCLKPADSVTVLRGFAGQLYTATLLIRGVIEMGTYTGGTVIPGTEGACVLDPTGPVMDGHNIYKLEISDPHQVYYLNRWVAATYSFPNYTGCFAARYIFDAQIYGGATVTMSADPVNGGEVTNFAQVVAPLVPGDPAFVVTQPYDAPNFGQFLSMDALAVY